MREGVRGRAGQYFEEDKDEERRKEEWWRRMRSIGDGRRMDHSFTLDGKRRMRKGIMGKQVREGGDGIAQSLELGQGGPECI